MNCKWNSNSKYKWENVIFPLFSLWECFMSMITNNITDIKYFFWSCLNHIDWKCTVALYVCVSLFIFFAEGSAFSYPNWFNLTLTLTKHPSMWYGMMIVPLHQMYTLFITRSVVHSSTCIECDSSIKGTSYMRDRGCWSSKSQYFIRVRHSLRCSIETM